MSSESEIILQYQDTKDRIAALKADYDAIFGLANTPEEYEALTVIKTQIRAEEKTLRDLQARLPARESFGARYATEILGPHEIAFTIPANVPRIRILEEAQETRSSGAPACSRCPEPPPGCGSGARWPGW